MKNKMAYLGPRGTFCEDAALRYIDKVNSELIPCSSIEAVFSAVHVGEVNSGIVPIENSCEGSVNQTLDLLAYEYDLKISGEIIVPIKHNLLARPDVKLKEISRILSHPQALAQCRKYLYGNFQGLEFMDVTSTAEAARQVANSDNTWAAIGTAEAAHAYGLAVLSPDIQDRVNNETRFIIISSTNWDDPYLYQLTSKALYKDLSPLHKTSILLCLNNKPGALFQALEQFYSYNVNLTKIESRPAKTRIGDYLFFIDIEGHHMESRVHEALEGIKSLANDVRVLGSYPVSSRTCC